MNLAAIDLSTECTGFSVFDIGEKKLLSHKAIRPKYIKTKAKYPVAPLQRMRKLAHLIIEELSVIKNLEVIVLEEINSGVSRIGQKTLDGAHYVLLHLMPDELLQKVVYIDSDGPKGWRTALNLRMSPEDSLKNKQAKQLNKRLPKGQHLTIITKKHLACRYVNARFKLNFDVDLNRDDSDVVDSIGLGIAYLEHFAGK